MTDNFERDLRGITADAPTALSRSYLDEGTSARFAEAFRNLSLAPYSVTEESECGPAFYYGANLYDTRPETSMSTSRYDFYFDRAVTDRDRFDRIVSAAGLPNPITDIFVPMLTSVFDTPVTVASEGGRSYYTPVVRSMSNGLHAHNDNSPLEAPELTIGQVVAQRSLLLYLDVPHDGSGAVEVFHKRPTEHDLSFNTHPEYGFTDAAIDNVAATHLEPAVGDLLAFDSWNIHRVLPSSPGSHRITVSTFFGVMPDGTIVLWS